ncbi:MAG: hypothetical protein H7061_09820 [Bdellovibrionaceae bacterium]|nr:hypothetical protein [Bdellovibrio sp.]
MAKFFVSCPIGFEAELQLELKSFWFEMFDLDGQPTRASFPECEALGGGLEFEADDHLGYQINLFSKIANRVLIRIGKFNSRYFDQFEKELQRIPLEKWLEPGPIQLKIESHKSRLNNDKSLMEASVHSLAKKKYTIVDSDGEEPTVYLRLQHDNCVVSLDTSGDHLHRRGYAIYRGEAPLRETLAAMMVRQLMKKTSLNPELTVIDPFVGSGTILFEVASAQQPLIKRNYSWLRFINRPKIFKSETWSKNFRWLQTEVSFKLIGFDLNDKSIANVERNEILFSELFPNVKLDLDVHQADSQSVDLTSYKNEKNLWIVTNPPYGHRLEQGEAVPILERLERELKPAGIIVLHPEAWVFHFDQLKPTSQFDFKNQGLKLKLSVFSK